MTILKRTTISCCKNSQSSSENDTQAKKDIKLFGLYYVNIQVHVYNQEFSGHVRKSNSAVDESRITSENRQPLSPKPAIKKKLPLLLKNRHFLDTTFMCIEAIDKMKLLKDMKKVEKQLNNPAPVKSSHVAEKKPEQIHYQKNPIRVDKSPTRPNPPGKLQLDNKFGPRASIKSPPVIPVNGVGNDKPSIQVSDWNGRSPTTPITPTSSYGLSKPVAPKVNPTPSYIKLADHRQIAKEIEKKAAEFGKPSSEADETNAPFNFQAMLKKTDYSRGSMKRQKGGGQGKSENDAAGPLLNSNKTGNSVVYQSKPTGNVRRNDKYPAPSPTKIEIAPGLVVEGEEADL